QEPREGNLAIEDVAADKIGREQIEIRPHQRKRRAGLANPFDSVLSEHFYQRDRTFRVYPVRRAISSFGRQHVFKADNLDSSNLHLSSFPAPVRFNLHSSVNVFSYPTNAQSIRGTA